MINPTLSALGDPFRKNLEIISVVHKRLVDENRHACLNERPGALDMLVSDIRGDEHGIDMANDVRRILHHMRNVSALGNMFSGELPIPGAANMCHFCSSNSQIFARFFVEVGRNSREGTFFGHPLAVIAIEHGAPRIRMPVAYAAT